MILRQLSSKLDLQFLPKLLSDDGCGANSGGETREMREVRSTAKPLFLLERGFLLESKEENP
jgi:hypothetical protein